MGKNLTICDEIVLKYFATHKISTHHKISLTFVLSDENVKATKSITVVFMTLYMH